MWLSLAYEDGSVVPKSPLPATASMPTASRIVGFPFPDKLAHGPEQSAANIASSDHTKGCKVASPQVLPLDTFKEAARRHFVRFFQLKDKDVETLIQLHIPQNLVHRLAEKAKAWSVGFNRMWFREMTHNLKQFLVILVERYPNGQLLGLTQQEREAAIRETFHESGAARTGLFHRLRTAVNIEAIITGQGPVTDLYREYYIALLDQMIRELWVEIGAGTLPTGPKKFSKRFYELQGTFARGPRWGHVTMDMFPFRSGDSQLSEPAKIDQNDEPLEPTAQKRKRDTEGTVAPSLQAPAQVPVSDPLVGFNDLFTTMEDDITQENSAGSKKLKATTKGKALIQPQTFFQAQVLAPAAAPVQGSIMAMTVPEKHGYLSPTNAQGLHTQGFSPSGSKSHGSNTMFGAEHVQCQVLHERAYHLPFEGSLYGQVATGSAQALHESAIHGPSSIFIDRRQNPQYLPRVDAHGFLGPGGPVPAQAQGHTACYGPNALFMDHSQVPRDHLHGPPFEDHQVAFGDGDGWDGYLLRAPDNAMNLALFDESAAFSG
jgi:hypothetical protein